MKSVFRALGMKATDQEINNIIRDMDVDGDGEVSFDEFVRVMGSRFYRQYTVQEVKAAFKHFDKNGDGFISANVDIFVDLNKL